MKTINRVVQTLNEKGKIAIAKTFFRNEQDRVKMILIELDDNVEEDRKEFIENYKELYNGQKEFLQKYGLFNKRYDRFYNQALEGKLNYEGLMKIK
ncbi:hypothetical protein M0R19_07050 [Candidatus Pacearchaeota archaeon]|jgi:hypothetical protein|nr:hypothetical protein [Candidatus Pacearchaeota archaeon]